MKDLSIQDQIDYLESYSNFLKSQSNMIDVQIKFLKAGKSMQDNVKQIQQMFPMMNLFNPLEWNKLNKDSESKKK